MSLAVINTRAVAGIHAYPITIEVHLSPGFPGLGIVGLPETAVKESRHRVRSAIINSGFEYPTKRITINLAPADIPKEGSGFDLPIALGILTASGQVSADAITDYELVGELALSGELKPIKNILPLAKATRDAGRALILPIDNADEANLISDCTLFTAPALVAVVHHINGRTPLPQAKHTSPDEYQSTLCMSDIRGQEHAKRALEIAAAGGHHLLACGPPGSGKTMLAHRMIDLLPSLSPETALEVASLYSISHEGFNKANWKKRPFRAPHHTVSAIAMAGGGKIPRPGEISLAHHGILFLDEFPEFQRHVLEVLREPLESQEIHISRAAGTATFPAAFQLIAAMNPCPCGYFGDSERACVCTQEQVQRYRGRLSGPLLDRIDLQVFVGRVPTKTLLEKQTVPTETSAAMRLRIELAHRQQQQRAKKMNALLTSKEMAQHCHLTNVDQSLLETAIDRLHLSVRSVHRVLKVARTIADLAESASIKKTHLSEALSYRL